MEEEAWRTHTTCQTSQSCWKSWDLNSEGLTTTEFFYSLSYRGPILLQLGLTILLSGDELTSSPKWERRKMHSVLAWPRVLVQGGRKLRLSVQGENR